MSNVQDQLNVYDQENDQLEIEINELKKDLNDVTEFLKGSEKETNRLREKIEHLTNNLSTYKEAHEEVREQLNHMQIRFAEQDSEVRNQRNRYEEALSDLEEGKKIKQAKELELKQLQESYEQKDSIENLTTNLKTYRQNLVTLNENIDAGREKRQSITHQRDDLEREVKEKTSNMSRKIIKFKSSKSMRAAWTLNWKTVCNNYRMTTHLLMSAQNKNTG